MIPLKVVFTFVLALQVFGLFFVWFRIDCSSNKDKAYQAQLDETRSQPEACRRHCGGNGRCVSRLGVSSGPGVCVCNPGWVGWDCTDTLQNWYIAAGLKEFEKRDGSLWTYLNSTAYRTRYAAVGHLLRSSRHILEVGGFLSPIDGFLQEGSSAQSVTVLDPTIEGFSTLVRPSAQSSYLAWRQVSHFPMTLAEYVPRGDEDALMFLGVQKEATFKNTDFEKFLKGSALRMLILEGAKTKDVQNRIESLVAFAKQYGFNVSLRMTFDFSEMAKELRINLVLAPANVLRRLCVLQRA